MRRYKEMSKVAVLMSFYNEPKAQILQSVNSILSQSFRDFELVIVNDAPGDEEMLKISQEVELLDDRIRMLYNEKNIGLAMSMNRAAAESESQYIARMDADDIAEPERFAKEIKVLDSEKYDLVCSNYVFINFDGTPSKIKSKYYPAKKILKALPYGNIIHHPTVMFTRALFERVNGYRDFPCSQDYDLWLRMLDNNARLCSLEDKLLQYRLRDNSITRSNPMRQIATLDYIRRLFNERKNNNGTDSYSRKNYLSFLSSVGVGNEKKERRYYKYKSIQERAIIKYRNGRKFAGAFMYLRAFFGSRFIRRKFLNGLRFRMALRGK